MRPLESGAGLFFTAFLITGCSGLLGLDDKTFDGSGGGTTGSGGATTPGSGGAGASTSASGGGDPFIATLDDELDFEPAADASAKALHDRGWRFSRDEEPYPDGTPYPQILVNNGALRIELADTLFWFGQYKGFLMYKQVTGDFLIVADVTSTALGPPGGVPLDEQSGAGILVRDPAGAAFPGGSQHWIAVDRGANQGTLFVHGTWTVASGDAKSTPKATLSPQGKVALCRIGNTFTIWSREADIWEPQTALLDSLPADAVPQPLQVGLFAYAAGATPATESPAGVLGSIDFVHHYDPVGSCNPANHGE